MEPDHWGLVYLTNDCGVCWDLDLTNFCPPFQHLLSERLTSHDGGTSGAPLKPLRDDSALRTLSSLGGLRGAPEVPPLWTKRTSVWIQINRKMVNTIWFQVDLIRFRKYFSVCVLTKSLAQVPKEESTYLNAVLVDGWKMPHQFVLVENPTFASLTFFWRMVENNKSAAVVHFKDQVDIWLIF